MSNKVQCDHCGAVEEQANAYRPWFFIRHETHYHDFCSGACVRGWLDLGSGDDRMYREAE